MRNYVTLAGSDAEMLMTLVDFDADVCDVGRFRYGFVMNLVVDADICDVGRSQCGKV